MIAARFATMDARTVLADAPPAVVEAVKDVRTVRADGKTPTRGVVAQPMRPEIRQQPRRSQRRHVMETQAAAPPGRAVANAEDRDLALP
jgi:hypothetical protein